MPGLDPRVLEALREQSGLSIDLDGRFRHRGELVTHGRTLEALWSSLRPTDDGRYEVEIGRERAYVRVEDAPYAVRGIALEPQGPVAHLSDGSAEPLDATTLAVDAEGVLHARVKGGAHRARFTRSAQVALGLALVEDRDAPAGYALELAGERHPVRRE
jgi:hypothetical protein